MKIKLSVSDTLKLKSALLMVKSAEKIAVVDWDALGITEKRFYEIKDLYMNAEEFLNQVSNNVDEEEIFSYLQQKNLIQFGEGYKFQDALKVVDENNLSYISSI